MNLESRSSSPPYTRKQEAQSHAKYHKPDNYYH